MATAKVIQTQAIILTLDEKEARWLRTLIQTSKEDSREKTDIQHRQSVWSVLNTQLV
jgi:predicted DNA-binding protein (UPF0251 family)